MSRPMWLLADTTKAFRRDSGIREVEARPRGGGERPVPEPGSGALQWTALSSARIGGSWSWLLRQKGHPPRHGSSYP